MRLIREDKDILVLELTLYEFFMIVKAFYYTYPLLAKTYPTFAPKLKDAFRKILRNEVNPEEVDSKESK